MGYIPQKSGTGLSSFDAVLLGRKPYIKWDVFRKDIKLTKKILKVMNLEEYALRYSSAQNIASIVVMLDINLAPLDTPISS